MADLRVPDLNNVIIAGRMTRDPELKHTGSGRPWCRLSIANTRYYKSKDGERHEETVFVEGAVWDKQAEWLAERLGKGRPVIVEGRLRQNEWEDRDSGQKRTKLELAIQRVTPLDWDGEREQGGGGQREQSRPAPRQRDIEEPMPDDEIPY